MWLTLTAAGFFALILFITLLRAEKSVVNGVLAFITMLAIAAAGISTFRGGFGPAGEVASTERPSLPAITASLPALACIDDLAGETVLTACEKVLFASADSTAAAINYAAARITRLTSFGDVAAANRNLTPELEALRRAVERDRYGLMAYVLAARDRCTAAACPAFRSLTDNRQIISNINERIYEGLVVRYSGSWNALPLSAMSPLPGIVAALPPGVPTGKPTNAEFPSASSTPPISIMSPEPPANSARAAVPPSTRPAAAAPAAQTPPAKEAAAPPAPKKQAPPKAAKAPTQLTPPSSPPPPQAPAADNE